MTIAMIAPKTPECVVVALIAIAHKCSGARCDTRSMGQDSLLCDILAQFLIYINISAYLIKKQSRLEQAAVVYSNAYYVQDTIRLIQKSIRMRMCRSFEFGMCAHHMSALVLLNSSRYGMRLKRYYNFLAEVSVVLLLPTTMILKTNRSTKLKQAMLKSNYFLYAFLRLFAMGTLMVQLPSMANKRKTPINAAECTSVAGLVVFSSVGIRHMYRWTTRNLRSLI